MQVEITRTTPIYRSPESTGVFIQWVIQSPTAAIDSVRIERSGSPEGPFESVIDNINTYYFYDNLRSVPLSEGDTVRENLNFLSLQRQIYYKVIATIGSEEISAVEPVGDQLKPPLLGYRRKMQRDLTVGLKFNGIPFAILKRRHWGLRCEICFDKLTKKVTDSKCNTCFGTGFEYGYFDPVEIKGRISVDNIQTSIASQGKSDINRKKLTMLTYPQIEPDDVLVELRQNNRYIVQHVNKTELKTVPVHQSITLSELARDSVEYRLPVNIDTIPVIY